MTQLKQDPVRKRDGRVFGNYQTGNLQFGNQQFGNAGIW